eukprot:g70345.t1
MDTDKHRRHRCTNNLPAAMPIWTPGQGSSGLEPGQRKSGELLNCPTCKAALGMNIYYPLLKACDECRGKKKKQPGADEAP